MEDSRKDYPVSVLCETLGVSLSGYSAWKKRPLSHHQREDNQLVERIRAAYHASRQVYRHPPAGVLFHSDRGSQYTSDAYRAILASASITVSMSRTGNCYDNAVTESFFGTLKGECVERACFQTRGQAKQTIFEYVECFYNRVRRHSSLGYVSPVAFEQVMCYP